MGYRACRSTMKTLAGTAVSLIRVYAPFGECRAGWKTRDGVYGRYASSEADVWTCVSRGEAVSGCEGQPRYSWHTGKRRGAKERGDGGLWGLWGCFVRHDDSRCGEDPSRLLAGGPSKG
ncbi:hypothetical protein L202_01271 [Cryptococcus amylolentus CBS 6039]|uniref:Uncharacterized protein n=1 Tax=Cryptococcus amylolentus CBS 6039 TaxID=1295533 RepID=A0A1E3I3U2_9TREE|nr:hypothetical protein L202_01271 [Cryptococcus amylolentus CBS 6039]ODN83045.1 hypothetical protein L202_01271 [Cryptococcus amylolentus CBS 6039]